MAKPNPVIQAIRTRRSVRGYQPGPVTKDQLVTIVDCGRLAPNTFNEQAWEFVVVTNKKTLNRIAKLVPDNGPFIADVPACIIITGSKSHPAIYLDGSAAAENMLLAAHALELGACWVQTYKKDYNKPIMKILDIPDSQVLIAMITIGMPFGEVEMPSKRSIKDVLHWEKF